jgi:hypothetical protein
MFKCERCATQSSAKTPPHLFPIATRQKIYPARRDRSGVLNDKGGTGHEVVREIRVCADCLAVLKAIDGSSHLNE